MEKGKSEGETEVQKQDGGTEKHGEKCAKRQKLRDETKRDREGEV